MPGTFRSNILEAGAEASSRSTLEPTAAACPQSCTSTSNTPCLMTALARQITELAARIDRMESGLCELRSAAAGDRPKKVPRPNAGPMRAPSTGDEVIPEITAGNESQNLHTWLAERSVEVVRQRSRVPFDATFDRFARILGDHFENLEPFYTLIKGRIGNRFAASNLSVRGTHGNQVALMVEFGTELARNGFLKRFTYSKRQRMMYIEPQDDGRVVNFFTGNWLERFISLRSVELLEALVPDPSHVDVLINPVVRLPNGTEAELDLLISCGTTVLWIECKTGSDYSAYVSRYRSLARSSMRMDARHAALVLLQSLTDEEKRNNGHLAGMSVLNLPDLEGFLRDALGST